MANNVYIGMRYVPVFLGEWSSSQSYEALSIVQYGNNTYTSKKPVPAGTLPTNTSYWALTGNYNGQISALDTRLTAAEGNITNLQADVNRLKNRRYLIFGDSYDVAGSVGASWSAITHNRLGIDMQVLSQGWAGFIGDGSHQTWGQIFSGATISNADKVTDVIIMGGANDRSATQAQLLSAMQNLETAIRAVCPNLARIHLGFLGYCIGYANSVRSQYVTTRQYYYNNANQLGWSVIPNICYTLCDSRNYREYPQSNHPNADGVANIANGLIQYLLHGTCDVEFGLTSEITINTSNFTKYTSTDQLLVVLIFKNGIGHLRFGLKPTRTVGGFSPSTGAQVFGTVEQDKIPFPAYARTGAIPYFYNQDGKKIHEWIGFGWNDSNQVIVAPNIGNGATLEANKVFDWIAQAVDWTVQF